MTEILILPRPRIAGSHALRLIIAEIDRAVGFSAWDATGATIGRCARDGERIGAGVGSPAPVDDAIDRLPVSRCVRPRKVSRAGVRGAHGNATTTSRTCRCHEGRDHWRSSMWRVALSPFRVAPSGRPLRPRLELRPEQSLPATLGQHRRRQKQRSPEASSGPLDTLVGATGFEPATTCTPCKYATRLRYAPT